MKTDKTDILISRMKSVIFEEVGPDDILCYARVAAELEYQLKIGAIKREPSLSAAARALMMKRTTLNEYLSKLGLKRADVKNGDYKV